MAPLAMMGLNRPAAASGMPMDVVDEGPKKILLFH